jgi:hypothetical protein
MKKRLLTIFIIVSLMPFAASAQTSQNFQENLPGPVNDLLNLVKGVKVSSPNLNVSQQSVDQTVQQIASGNTGDLSSWWQSINGWFSANIGVSLADIIKAVVNLVIWVWELVIKLLQSAVQNL